MTFDLYTALSIVNGGTLVVGTLIAIASHRVLVRILRRLDRALP